MATIYNLDTRVFVIVAALTSLCIGITFAFAWMIALKQRCIAIWASGFLLLALGYLLVGTRGIAPDLVSIMLANGLVITGGFGLIRGLDEFLGLRNKSWQLISTAAITLCLLLYYTYVQPSLNLRIVVVSAALGVFAFVAAWRLVVNVTPKMHGIQTFVATLFTIHGFVMTYRIADSLLTTTETDLFRPSVTAAISLLDFLLLFPCIGMGMLSMVHTRQAKELESEIALRQASEIELLYTANNLKDALAEIKTLKGIIPICAYCKKIRDDLGGWEQLEVYIRTHSDAEFSHGICPDCLAHYNPDLSL